LYTPYTLYIVHYIRAVLYTLYTLYNAHYICTILYTSYTLYIVHYIRAVLYTLYTLYNALYIRSMLYTLRRHLVSLQEPAHGVAVAAPGPRRRRRRLPRPHPEAVIELGGGVGRGAVKGRRKDQLLYRMTARRFRYSAPLPVIPSLAVPHSKSLRAGGGGLRVAGLRA
jgi:hypothetical protein